MQTKLDNEVHHSKARNEMDQASSQNWFFYTVLEKLGSGGWERGHITLEHIGITAYISTGGSIYVYFYDWCWL